ncbi:UNVERIFIED_CONTAM: hypothetical protein Sangu_3209700 [Sesamum angustifolium]|uniref:DUF4283 domain-containing protein n=1 Tax=Sesamum angustifolium TaxID=2727405 RepID=A0AAW2JKT4_9LAMI
MELDTSGCSSPKIGLGPQEQGPQDTEINQEGVAPHPIEGLVDSEVKEGRDSGINRENPDCPSEMASHLPLPVQDDKPSPRQVIYVGNVKLQAGPVDNIAGAFLQSSRKTLHFVPPTRQNGEVIIRPTKEVVDNGSKIWHTTAVGYFLGRRPYFPQLESFARANWKGLQHVSATSSGFFFFRFHTRFAMEDVIEGGPWLFLGQPIVLQCWEQGMSLRRQQHTHVPVWIRLKHLPMEYWTEEGLSTVASGIGTPLYSDGITKDCSRLDYARVCVMLNYNSDLPKHLVVISPVLRNGKEDPKRVDVEYEWLPQKCSNCCSLGHVETVCPANSMKKTIAPPIKVFVKKRSVAHSEQNTEVAGAANLIQFLMKRMTLSYRVLISAARLLEAHDQAGLVECRGLNGLDHQRAVEHLVRDHKLTFLGLIETRVSQTNVQRIRRNLLTTWSWFDDYSGPAGRIWLVWDSSEVDVEILRVESQLIHCRASNKRMHTSCLISVLYGDYDIIPRRTLWGALCSLSAGITDEPWLVLGDFNAVVDDSEVCGRAADTSASMLEFRTCIRDTGLVQLPVSGCPYTWHNCSEGMRSLWKRLDRMLVNTAWLDAWPNSSYICALPSTSDHSPLILSGMNRFDEHVAFRFDNYLTHLPGFSAVGGGHLETPYSWDSNLLKAVFRSQKRMKGNLTENVTKAKSFLDKAQALLNTYNEDIFLNLVKCCRRVFSVAVNLEITMLKQRAKLRWMKHGDQSSKVFFRKINASRVKQRVFQIKTVGGNLLTAQQDVTQEFISYFQNLLGGTSQNRGLNLEFLRSELKHSVTTTEASLLVAPVTQAEVKEAFFDIDVESAPGPDGYTAAFYRTAWPVVGQAVFQAVGEGAPP